MDTNELLTRLTKAAGPDRDLDEALFEFAYKRKRRVSTFEQYDPSEQLPRYTGSISDAIGLIAPDETLAVQIGPITAIGLCIELVKARI